MKKSIFKAALIFCMILCLASGLVVFSACTVGQKDTGEDTSGITSGDSDSEGDNTGDNDGGDTSGDSDNTGDETGDNTGDNTGDDTGTPPAEITEEDCYNEMYNLTEQVLFEYSNGHPERFSNIKYIKTNTLKGTIYCSADYTVWNRTSHSFYTIDFDKPFLTEGTYEEILNNLQSFDPASATVKSETVLQPEISEELFNEFCEYIKRQSYTYGDEVIDFSAIDPQNLEIINVTNTISSGGWTGFGFKILDTESNKIYDGNIMGALGSSSVDDQIIELMGKTTNFFEITEISEFQEFDLSA